MEHRWRILKKLIVKFVNSHKKMYNFLLPFKIYIKDVIRHVLQVPFYLRY